MNKKYRIRLKPDSFLPNLTPELLDAWEQAGYCTFNKVLQQYGLVYDIHEKDSVYEVIDETLFGLFLLEHSDELHVETYIEPL